jgi:putative aldouronate transport system substrate-binding protein
VLLLILGSCGGNTKTTTSTTTAGTKTPITFTFYSEDATEDMPFTDPVARKITELTGVTLIVDHPVAGDSQTQALMLASGQYPDLIAPKGGLTQFIEAGAVIPLDDLIEKRGKHIKELYGDQIVRLRNSVEDPHIYNAGTYGVKTAIWTTDGTMQLQHAVLKELGYPRMRTLTDYENAIRTYIQRHPTINGQKTIGLSLLIDTWQWYIDLSNPSNFVIGFPDDGQWIVDPNTLEAQYKFLYPNADLWFRWLNKMNTEGLLDPESFTQKEDEWKAKIASGRVLGLSYALWGYADARTSLIRDGMEDRTYAYLPITADERFQAPSLKDYGFGGGYGVAISSTCKDPERAFEFLDWLCSEEAQILNFWGIEGEHYNVVNGRRVIPEAIQKQIDEDPDFVKKTGVTRWTYPFPQRGNGYIDSTGSYITRDNPEYIRANYRPIERETLAAYGAERWTDIFPSTESLGVSRHGAVWQYSLAPEINAIITEADDYVKTALSNIVLGRPENFDAAWNTMIQDLKNQIGIETANRAVTELIKAKVGMWEN